MDVYGWIVTGALIMAALIGVAVVILVEERERIVREACELEALRRDIEAIECRCNERQVREWLG